MRSIDRHSCLAAKTKFLTGSIIPRPVAFVTTFSEKGVLNGAPSGDLLIGKVVQYHIVDELYEDGRIDAERLRPISRLAGSYYTKLGEVFSLKRQT